MTAPGRIGRLLGVATLLSVVGAGAALAMGNIAWAGGFLLGAFLGLTPFASWAWIMTRGLETRRNKAIAVLILLSKLGVYGLAITILVRGGLVSIAGVTAGMTGAIGILLLGLIIRPAPGARETS